MRYILKILVIILLLIVAKSQGQTCGCDSVYNNPEIMPQFKNEFKGLLDYLKIELVPIIAECIKRDTEIIASLYIILTIDTAGKVIDATFPRYNLTSLCKYDLKQKLLTMNGWTPGQNNRPPVCSKIRLPISCLKWE